MPGEMEIFGELCEADANGGAPWLMCVKKYQKRFGTLAVPTPGAPSLFVSLDQTLQFHAFPIAPFLETGTSLKDADSFLNTDAGKTFMDERSVFLQVPAQNAVFVSAGWTVYLFLADGGVLPKRPTLRVAGVLAATIFAKGLFENVAEPIQRAVWDWNMEHFNTKKSSEMWSERRRAFEAVFKPST